MTSDTDPGTRWRIVRDVAVFQFKCGLEAVLDLTLIPTSLAAAGVDLLVGNWRRPRFFHTVLRFGERCEDWIDLWGVAPNGMAESRPGVDAVMQNIEAVIRDPRTGPHAVRTLRRWAAMKLAGVLGTDRDMLIATTTPRPDIARMLSNAEFWTRKPGRR